MKKKVIAAILTTLSMSVATAWANVPDTNLQQGDIFGNIETRRTTPTLESGGQSISGDKLNTFDASVGIGFGNKAMGTLEYTNYGSDTYNYAGISHKFEFSSYDLTGHYQLSKNFNALAGYRRFEVDYSNSLGMTSSDGSKNLYFVGAAFSQKLDKKGILGAYANFKVGTDSWNEWVAGLDCKVMENMWLDVNYKASKYTLGTLNGQDVDLKLKGWALGLTYKF